jgi:hypothetical protein
MAEDKNFTNIAGLNFYDIKYNLINYLRTRPEFSDYNLEGSNLTILLDLLSYNTSQQGFYNAMVANEMFIDRATKRSSIVSMAKLLGYTPNTKKAAKAQVLVIAKAADLPDSGVLPAGTLFSGYSDAADKYPFTNPQSYVFYPYQTEVTEDPDASENGNIISYACGPVELRQGVYNTISYNVASYDEQFLITDKDADKNSIRVYVMNSVSDIAGFDQPWSLSTDLTTLNENTRAFFLEENAFGQLTLSFGDGVLGKKVETGNVVIIQFLSTSGAGGNNVGIADTATSSSFHIDDGNYTLLTIEPSNSGADRETSTSIKKNAVRNYTARERAVTINDYEGIILGSYNENVAVRCWGGEDNDPPFYGRVFASVRPIGSTILSTEEKNNLVNNILKQKNIVGVDVSIVDPEILYVNVNANVYYDRTTTNIAPTTISQKIKQALNIYFTQNLVEFGDSVFAQDVETQIRNTSPAIKAADTEFVIEKRATPTLNVKQRIMLDFQNELYHPYDGYQSIVTTNTFKILVGSSYVNHFIQDDGNGNLKLIKRVNNVETVANSKYGTIDYTTGKLEIPSLLVNKFEDSRSYIRFKVVPSTNNIFTKRNSILSFETNSNDALTITLTEVKPQIVVGGSGSVITKPGNY